MNLLEKYIIEIHSIKEKEYNGTTFIIADITTGCYRRVKREQKIFTP